MPSFQKLCAGFVLAATACAGSALASTEAPYPSRMVSLVVPTTPGGTADILGRLIGPKLAEKWGQTVVVENRPGAGTLVGTDYVARAKPDGHTLMVTFNELATLPAINKNAKVDVLNDFIPVARIGSLPVAILVHPNMPVNTLQELIDLCKAEPGKYTYSSNGSGGVLQLYTEMFKQEAGVDIMHVPYKGALEASMALIAGEVDVLVQFASGNVQNHVHVNRMKALAIASPERLEGLPNVPTTAEAGLPSLLLEPWYGVFAPAGTPKPIVDKVNADIGEVLQHPDVRERLTGVAMKIETGTPEEFAQFYRSEYERWTTLIKTSGIESN